MKKRAQDRITQVRPVQIRTARQHLQCSTGLLYDPSGDTLYQISIENYGTMDKVADICRANGISENEIIYPGQIIVLPEKFAIIGM